MANEFELYNTIELLNILKTNLLKQNRQKQHSYKVLHSKIQPFIFGFIQLFALAALMSSGL